MASTVPYSGVPSVAPEDRPIPTEQVQTPLAAFGGETAQALEHLGQVSQSAGTELYSRAVAMQETFEQAKASEAVSNFVDAQGQRYNAFTSLQGRAAVEGYQPFLDGMRDDRAAGRAGLDSPYAQRAYDQESRTMASRLAISAGAHAGQQNKQYLVGTAGARVQAAQNQMGVAPEDNDIAAANIAEIRTQAQFQADQLGLSPDQAKEHIAQAVSGAITQRITALTRTQPFTAKKLLDQYSQSGDLQSADAAKLGDAVQRAQWTVGGRQIASVVGSGNNNQFGQGIIDVDRAAAAIRSIESGSAKGTYNLIHPPAKNGDYAIGAYGVMHNNLAPWLKDAGMPVMSDQEFAQNPQAQDQLFKFRFQRDMQKYGSANAAANVWFSGSPNVNPNPAAGDGHTSQPEYQTKFNAALAQTASLKELSDTARAKAEQMTPGDSMLGDIAVSHIEQLYNQQQRITKDQEFDARSTVEGALVTGMQNGNIPTTVQDLQADPKVAQAWEGLSAVDQRKYMGILARNSKGDVAMTEPRLQTYQRLLGESINDPEAFLKEDLSSADLPMSTRKELIGRQAQVYRKADADPQTTRALAVLGQTNMTTDLKADKQGYAQFTGALHDELAQFQTDNKRPPKDQEIQTIGARLLLRSGGGWFSSGTPFFQADVPTEAADAIRGDPAWQRLGVVPDDNMVRRIYLQKQYQTLYGAKPPTPKAAAPQPMVPHSE